MEKIKVAHILHSVGGVDVSLRLILENLDTVKFENIVIHGREDTKQEFVDRNLKCVKRYQLPISREISVFKDIISVIQAYRIIKNEKPDLIHAHSAKGGVIGRMVGTLTGTKVLYTPQAFSFLSSPNRFKKAIYLFIEKIFSKGNSYLLASSKSEMDRGIKEVGFFPEKVLLFNNAIEPIIDIDPLSIKKNWPDNYICTVGRPCYQKNIDKMIQILCEVKKHRDVHLVLMGVGYHASQLDQVKRLIDDLNLKENVTLLNWTNRKDVLHIISKAKLYLSTARYEGLPYSVIESMALSKPCVVSDCDGNRDLIVNEHNGYIIKNNDTIEFSNKIIELLDDQDRYNEFSTNSKELFDKHYNIKKRICELESIYSNLLLSEG